MINVAILGYGVVGSGVAEVLRKNAAGIKRRSEKEIKLKRILDIREFPDSPERDLFTKNPDDIFEDDSIKIVVETIGGTRNAYQLVKEAIKKGKHVVTSNKELVAAYGSEILKLAWENNVNFLFEASVGGGIPIIRPLSACLAANEIMGITGILNGTTNYILTQMKEEGKDFATALYNAKKKGYAEADPTNDIEGFDTSRKIAILSSIAYNEYVNSENIHTEGITGISFRDMQYAEVCDRVIKLAGVSKKIDDKIYVIVSPFLINKSNALANVEDVFNAIVVKGNVVGEVMFYGKGAGKLPTASAVVADIIDIVKNERTYGKNISTVNDDNNLINYKEASSRFFTRLKVSDVENARQIVKNIFGDVHWVCLNESSTIDELAFITPLKSEKLIEADFGKLCENSSIVAVESSIRLLEE